MGKNLDGAADVVLHQLKLAAHILGELADIEVIINEQNTDHGRRQEVGQVVCHHGQFVDLLLVFGVDGVQLLVDGLQLFIRALQFFVGGQQFLIGGLQLFIDRLQLADGLVQVVLRLLQFLLKVGDATRDRGVDVVLFDNALGRQTAAFLKEHGNQAGLTVARHGDGLDQQVDAAAARGAVDGDAGIGRGRLLGAAAAQCRRRGQAQVFIDDVEQVKRRFTRRDGHVVEVVAEEMDDIVALVEHDRRRQEFFQKLRIHRFEGVARNGPAFTAGPLGLNGLNIGHVERGRRQVVHFASSVVNIDFFCTACGLKDAGVFVGGLTFAQKEVAAVFECRMKDGEQTALQNLLKVNHHVAAADKVKLAERRVRQHVVRRKDNHAPDVF